MNAEQKIQIQQLRENGVGIKKIADTLKLTRDSVKSYCNRHHIAPKEKSDSDNDFCLYCFKKLVHTPKHKKKKFCGIECKQKWWSQHRELIKHKKTVICHCKYCGSEFQRLPSSNQKFCNQKCYFAYRYGEEGEKIE